MGSDPDSGIGCPELSDSGGSGGSRQQQGRSVDGGGEGGAGNDYRYALGENIGSLLPPNKHLHNPRLPPLRTFSQPEEATTSHDNHFHHHHHRHGGITGSASRDLWTEDRMGRPQPLKGILKNGQFSATLPAGCSCDTQGPLSQAACHNQTSLLLFGSSALGEPAASKTTAAAAVPKEKLRKDEVLDTVESSV